MAMTQEQQREAARRILEREPLTPEEMARYKMLVKTPDEYEFPKEKRTCGWCGATFRDTVDGKGSIQKTALEKFSDHQLLHNPTPDKWAEAYRRIEKSREANRTT